MHHQPDPLTFTVTVLFSNAKAGRWVELELETEGVEEWGAGRGEGQTENCPCCFA